MVFFFSSLLHSLIPKLPSTASPQVYTQGKQQMDNSPFHSDKLIANSCYCVIYYSFGDSGIGSIVITQLNFSLLESLVCILFSSILSMSGWLLFFYVQTFFIPSGTVTAYAGKVVRLEKFLQETYQEIQQNFCDGLFAFS